MLIYAERGEYAKADVGFWSGDVISTMGLGKKLVGISQEGPSQVLKAVEEEFGSWIEGWEPPAAHGIEPDLSLALLRKDWPLPDLALASNKSEFVSTLSRLRLIRKLRDRRLNLLCKQPILRHKSVLIQAIAVESLVSRPSEILKNLEGIP